MKHNDGTFRDAEYWTRSADGAVMCELCPRHCHLKEGQSGFCKVRGVRHGVLKALAYGQISSAQIDPVEKKPLYHFHPGAPVYSIGGWGCNFSCLFCQNWTISQRMEYHGTVHPPAEVIQKVVDSGCRLIAYTYNEPLVGYEYVRDCSHLARERGLKNILVTNGFIERDPAAALLPLVDALNVDIKSMTEAFYHQQCQGALAPVHEFCKQARRVGCHLEITNLVIPGLNDQDSEFDALARWMRDALGECVPLHISAYHPDYKANHPPTPGGLLLRAAAISRKYLEYVYVGNVATATGQSTACPGCGELLMVRQGYRTQVTGLANGACRRCSRKADVVI